MDDNIYSTVPDEAISRTVPPRRRVYDFLKRSVDAVTAKEIAIECGFPQRGTHVEVRKAITELIEVDHLPIVATGRGFKIGNITQVRNYIESLVQRRMGVDRRIRSLNDIERGMQAGIENGTTLEDFR